MILLAHGQVENRIDFLSAVERLEQDYDVIFAFDHHLLANVEVGEWDASLNLDDVLTSLSDDAQFRFELVGNTVLVIPEEDVPVVQHVKISGRIAEESTKLALPNAIVRIKETNQHALTDKDGYFELSGVPVDSEVEISYLGYHAKSFPVSEFSNSQVFHLKHNAEVLKEVTITEMNHSFANDYHSHGNKVDPGMVNNMPNLGGPDVLRAMQMLPGVRGTNESSADLVVRGTGSNQVLTQFDGMTIYRTDHFFGNLGAFNSDIIQSAHLHKSAFRAPWGTRASSVMDISSRRGSFDKLSGSVGFNLLNASATLETPVADNVSLLIAGRRAFSDIIQSGLYKRLFDNSYNGYDGLNSNEGLLENSQGVESSFYFYDINAKLSWKTDPNSIIDFSFYNGFDNLIQQDESTSTWFDGSVVVTDNWRIHEKNVWGNSGFSANWSRDWQNGLFTDVQIAHSRFTADQDFNSNLRQVVDSAFHLMEYDIYGYVALNNVVKETSVRLNSEYSLSLDHKLGFGAYAVDYHASRGFVTTSTRDYDYVANGRVNGFYGEWQASLTERLSIIPGIRISKYSVDNRIYREPRLAINYQLNRHLSFKASTGKHYQFMVQVETVNKLLNNNDLWILADGLDIPVMESNHYVAGATWTNKGFALDVEAYYKSTTGMLEFVEVPIYELDSYNSTQVDDYSFYNVGEGRSYGIDLILKKQTNVYTGWISYSLGRSEIRLPDTNDNNFFPSEFDQTHELKFTNMITLGDWDFSMNWIYGSGVPYTMNQTFQVDDSQNSDVEGYATFDIELNNRRLPAYHRLDIGIARHFQLQNSRITSGLNIQNVYDRANIRKIVNLNESGDITPQAVTHLGFTPSVYFKLYF